MPVLPPEIWLYVFALASYIPGAFDTRCPNAITAFTYDPYGICVHNRFSTVMNTKLALSRVCRCWNVLARQVLFQYIIIRDGKHALAIADALKDCAGSNKLGLSTIRLEIALEGVHIWTEEHTCAVLRIFESCPNLVCFSTAFSTADPSVFQSTRLINALRFHESLKRVELKTDAEIIEALAEAVPSVQVLWLWPCRRQHTAVVQRTLRFPNLHTLISEYEGGTYMRGLTLPALRAIRIPHELHMPSLHVEDVEFLDVRNLNSLLPTIHCWANLKTMTIRCFELTKDVYPWSECIPNTSVECIIIDGLQRDQSTRWTIGDHITLDATPKVLSTNLFQLISTFLGLRSIRFLIPCQATDWIFHREDMRRIWEKWLEKCDALMIILEVSQGSEEISADEYQVIDPRFLYRKLICNYPILRD